MKAMKAFLNTLVRSAALLVLLGGMMVLGAIFEGGLSPLPGVCALALLAGGLYGLACALQVFSAPARPRRAVRGPCPQPCKRRRQGLRAA